MMAVIKHAASIRVETRLMAHQILYDQCVRAQKRGLGQSAELLGSVKILLA